MDKTTGLKVSFMSDYPELGRLDSLDIYADEFRDGKSLKYHNANDIDKFSYSVQRNISSTFSLSFEEKNCAKCSKNFLMVIKGRFFHKNLRKISFFLSFGFIWVKRDGMPLRSS